MKPTFALDLSRDLIALLHRTPKGWLTIGEVAFDAPDMAEELDFLRKTALGLSPMGVATKLILPAFGAYTGGMAAGDPAILALTGASSAALLAGPQGLLRFPLG